MKKINPNVCMSLLFLAAIFIASSCQEPTVKQPPITQPTSDKIDGIKVNVPDIFHEPVPECAKVTNLRFFGQLVSPGFTNWDVGWEDGINVHNTYAIKIFDRRVSETQAIWSWMVSDKSLSLGVLEGNPDDSTSFYTINIQTICPQIGSSGIIVDDVVMK